MLEACVRGCVPRRAPAPIWLRPFDLRLVVLRPADFLVWVKLLACTRASFLHGITVAPPFARIWSLHVTGTLSVFAQVGQRCASPPVPLGLLGDG